MLIAAHAYQTGVIGRLDQEFQELKQAPDCDVMAVFSALATGS
jgi:hypothetical protein